MNTLSPEDRLRIEDAAKQFWKRLIGIARHELDQRVAGRIGASDVVQSALESLWKAANHGKLVAHDTEDCWGLLCMIVSRKAKQKNRYHRRKRRDVRREISLDVLPSEAVEDNCGLTEDDLLGLADEIASIRLQLDESDRLIFDVCLQGESVAQIAELVQKSRWTIRRSLNRTGELLRAKVWED